MTHFDFANSKPAIRSSAPAAMISQQPANQWVQKAGQVSQYSRSPKPSSGPAATRQLSQIRKNCGSISTSAIGSRVSRQMRTSQTNRPICSSP